MSESKWKYYNHAIIPVLHPHEEADASKLFDGSIWKEFKDKKPLFARYTTNFNCNYETDWWYVIREKPYDIMQVSTKERKSIRQAEKKCTVKKIFPVEYSKEMYDVFVSAFDRYEGTKTSKTYEQYQQWCKNNNHKDCWAAFDIETGLMIGYLTVTKYEIHADITTAKFMPEFLNRQASDALYHNILDYYLNELGLEYISSGERNINHKTGTQDYKIRRFGYKKAYCDLHIVYRPGFSAIIKFLYVFRKIFSMFDFIGIIHNLNSLLFMEEINIKNKKVVKK